ncbi:MAG: response regulator [Halieaceae bacterium]
MHSDNNHKPATSGKPEGFGEDSLDVTLDWLLDQDLADADETLFTLGVEQAFDTDLTETEAAMAARPMIGGNTQADALAGFVEEEIVLSSVGETSDIYASTSQPGVDEKTESTPSAVVLNPNVQPKSSVQVNPLEEGLDILGLDDNDDIGEKPLVIKRARQEVEPKVSAPAEAVANLNLSATDGELQAEEAAVTPTVIQSNADNSAELAMSEAAELDQLIDNETAKTESADFAELDLVAQAQGLDAGPDAIDENQALDFTLEELYAQDNGASDEISFDLEVSAFETTESDYLDIEAIEAIEGLGADNKEIDIPEAGSLVMQAEMMEPSQTETTAVEPAAVEPAAVEQAAEEQPAIEFPQEAESADDHSSVFDYVASQSLPSDEHEFDQFLLRGEHLADIGEDLGELAVQHTEGVASLDTEISADIDYHDDFTVTGAFSAQAITSVTEVIADVMEELTVAVSARLIDLGYKNDELNLSFMLGGDAEAIAECLGNGFAPITQINSQLPAAMSHLGQEAIDAIYISIANGNENNDWNRIFSEDFPAAAPTLLLEQLSQISQGESIEAAFNDEPAFDPLSLDSDGDELGDTLGVLGAVSDASLDDFDFLDTNASDSGEGFEATLDDAWVELQASEEETAEPAQAVEVFDDDLFSDDAMEALNGMSGEEDTDLDSLFKGLGESPVDIDDVCGIAVDAFESNSPASNEQVAPEREPLVASEPAEPEVDDSDINQQWFMPAGIEFSYTSQSSTELFADFLDAFLEEGALELEKLEDAICVWEKDINSEAAFAPVSRILHTLKGIAKGVGLQRYGTLIHNFETLLDKLPKPADDCSGYFRIVNLWLDAAIRGFEQIEDSRADVESEIPQPPAGAVSVIETAVVVEAEVDNHSVLNETAESATVEADSSPTQTAELGEPRPEQKKQAASRAKDKQLADEGAKTLAAQQTIRMTPDAVDHLMNLTNQAQQLGVRSSQGTVKGKLATAELQGRLTSIRSHISKIADRSLLNVKAHAGQAIGEMDALEMDQYSELQEAANILREGVEDLGDLIQLCSRQSIMVEALLKQQASVVASLRSSIQGARVIPVSRLMPGLRRIVRTVGAELGKAVNFRVINEVGSLDRDNFNRCQIILEHMVRNALDHGVESPDERVVAGKQMTGRITVDVSKEGGDYLITLADDGRGIDPDMMREVAFEKGLDLNIADLTDEEAQRLIFHKGFSTATELSEISGRGVGMDIVFSELQQIGGDIEITSDVGQGTTFKIRIPSNITVNGALLVNAGTASYAVPLDGLVAVEHVPADEFFARLESGEPLQLFGMDCETGYLGTICGGENIPPRKAWGNTVPVIIAGNDDRFMAIAIDGLEQALELVIRSLGNQFSAVPGIAGGATTADGQAVVALDLNALVSSLDADGVSVASTETERAQERMMVLVVDDSRTQRMVATSQFDSLGVETVTAENGLVAIELLNTAHKLPDVILLDIEMPVKDGIQTLREIRKSNKYSHIPVIMVTSRTGAKHRKLAEQAGCSGYMGKPFNFPLLVQDINRLTGRQLELV